MWKLLLIIGLLFIPFETAAAQSAQTRALALLDFFEYSLVREKYFLSDCLPQCSNEQWLKLEAQLASQFPQGAAMKNTPDAFRLIPEVYPHFQPGQWLALINGVEELSQQIQQLNQQSAQLSLFLQQNASEKSLPPALISTLYLSFNQFALDSWIFSLRHCTGPKACDIHDFEKAFNSPDLPDYRKLMQFAERQIYPPEQVKIELNPTERLILYRSFETLERRIGGLKIQLAGANN